MADPRIFTVDNGTSASCRNQNQVASSNRRTFFQAAGKIGDLEVLNDVGAGNVGRGLRTLAGISNSVRTGCGSLPSILGETAGKVLDGIDDGAEWVLGKVGLSGAVASAVRGFHPGVANQAYGSAKTIYDRVKQGHFKIEDIPSYMQDFQDLERLGRSIFTPGEGDGNSALADVCQASPYAMDLVSRAPKYKFLFLVQFIYTEGYTDGPKSLAFLVNKSDRPDVEYVTEEVNYYNFQTKVITSTKFKDMSMTFYDDTKNQAMKFYNYYRAASVPVSQISSAVDVEMNGMNFEKGVNSAMFGPFKDSKSMLSEIRLFHLYDYGRLMNVYKFLNPRILNLELDDLDMSDGSNGSEFTMKFFYDTVIIESEQSVDPKKNPAYNIEHLSHAGDGNQALFPLRYVDDQAAVTSPQPELPLDGSGSASCNPLNTVASNGIAQAANGLFKPIGDIFT